MPRRHLPIPLMPNRGLLVATILLLSQPVYAETLRCQVTYGGETRELEAHPVSSPYSVPVQAVGSYFLFRMVFQKEPADLAAIRLYVFADRSTGPVPIQQATHPYPPPSHAGATYGFTGLNRVYEPIRDGELQYWCALSSARGLRQ